MAWNRVLTLAGLLAAFVTVSAPVQAQDRPRGGEVFILADEPLDEPRGLCLDIPGHGDRVDVTRHLVVHTCKRDIWNLDERFSAAAFEDGILQMPEYDLCVAARDPQAGVTVGLESCDGTPAQRWVFAEKELRPAANTALCLTIGPEPSALTPGGQRLPSRHVARSLGLQGCSDAAADRQRWKVEVPVN